LHEGSINRENFLGFEKRLISNKRHKIFLILDSANSYHSKILKECVEKHKEGIEVWYLPPYSPDDHINSDVKYGIGSKSAKRTKERLRAATEGHMNILKKSPI
jgi:hypothetical protein